MWQCSSAQYISPPRQCSSDSGDVDTTSISSHLCEALPLVQSLSQPYPRSLFMPLLPGLKSNVDWWAVRSILTTAICGLKNKIKSLLHPGESFYSAVWIRSDLFAAFFVKLWCSCWKMWGTKEFSCFILGCSQIFNMWNTSKSDRHWGKAPVCIICGNCSFCMENNFRNILM